MRNKAIEEWITKASKSVIEESKKEWPKCEANWTNLGFTKGNKYYRLFTTYSGQGKSAYCFIDTEGNIFMAASWKAPAKGIRGTIDSVDPTVITSSTDWLYR